MYLEDIETNKDCLDPVSLEVQRLGGAIPFFGFLGIFVLLATIVFAMLSYRSGIANQSLKELPEVLYQAWLSDNES